MRDIFWKKFKSHKSAKLEIFRFINNAHSTTAQLFDDAVMRDGLTDHHAQGCYGGGLDKSTRAEELPVSHRFINVAIALIDQFLSAPTKGVSLLIWPWFTK